MSKELAILFIHRGVTPVGYAASNMASAQKSAPDADVIPEERLTPKNRTNAGGALIA